MPGVLPSTSIPPLFLERMQALLGREYDEFRAASAESLRPALRANTLKISPEDLRQKVPFSLEPVVGIEACFLAPVDSQPGKHPYHAAGLYYIQDPAAMVAAQLLLDGTHPGPDRWVIDLAAAPGGKSTHLASLMEGQGVLLANEIDQRRVWDLVQNMERWGARQAVIANESPQSLAQQLPGRFDQVLLDAPCSGEGMFPKSEAARLQWSPNLVTSCAVRQGHILEEAAQLVRLGGRLLYSTCTFSPEENEILIASFLERHPDFKLLDPPPLPGFRTGRPEWAPGFPKEIRDKLVRTVRLWPQHWPGGGHFLALFERHAPGALDKHEMLRKGTQNRKNIGGPNLTSARQAFEAFSREVFGETLSLEPLHLMGSVLYALPPSWNLLDGQRLRMIRPGWLLGEVRDQRAHARETPARFEPAHALALGLRREQAGSNLDLPVSSQMLFKYLKGEALSAPGENGWTVVSVDGYPLGWGKRANNILKNHYPKGLRWY